MKYLLLVTAFIFSQTIVSQTVTGKWKTIDDETGNAKSIVEIYEKNGKLYGKVIELINPKQKNPVCDLCEDDRKDQPVEGMEIIRGMVKDGDEYDDGTICDPANGKIYDCKLWIDEDDSNKLKVRGYLYFFYRTQTWERVKN